MLHIIMTETLHKPGEYPFRAGLFPAGHNVEKGGKLWTMRMFAGFGDAVDTNARFLQLIKAGQTGFSTAYDMATLYGYDSDDPEAEGEFGTCGVGCSSVLDMERIFQGIKLDETSVSMTINSPAPIIFGMFIVAAERQGVSMDRLSGTLQNDILKEFTAQNEYIFPPEPSMRLVTDVIEFATQYMPSWNPVSISGYHIREAGSSPEQELAFTLADGMAYVEACLERGLDIDDFAPRLSFFFNSSFPQGGGSFFGEIAKFRAAREIWATTMKEVYGAQNERSWRMRFHAQTAGASLSAHDIHNNITRTSMQALAAILGGAQSLHTNSYDEALAVPTEEAALTALRSQLLLAHETGIPEIPDPLGNTPFMEEMTQEMIKKANFYFDHLRKLGNGSMLQGVLRGIENGYITDQIAQSSFEYQQDLENGKVLIVGENAYRSGEESMRPPILKIDQESLKRQLDRLKYLRSRRDPQKVKESLDRLRSACVGTENVMPAILASVRAEATLGEMMRVMREVFGEHMPNNF